MNKYLICVGILVLLFSSYIGAVVVSEPSTPVNPNQSQDYAELFARVSSIESRLNVLPTNESITGLLQGHLELTNAIMEQFRSAIVVLQIVINLLFLGIGYAIYFNLKSKGRV